jgi:hypothetical protein
LKRWPAGKANRFHARWLTAAALALATVAGLVAARPAGAAVTLGQVAPSPPSPQCSSTADYLQPSITGGNLYIARQAGTITSWSTNSSGDDATYVFKVFRRTTDPDVFQVIAHAPPRDLTFGLNTVPVNIAVRSGDMIGINQSGGLNSCTFSLPGDGVLTRTGSLSDGGSGAFTPVNDVRLNLSAVLVPSNAFSLVAIARDLQLGTATMTVNASNPGVLTISGKGMKKRNASKNVAVAGNVVFKIAAVGAKKRKLLRTGQVSLAITMTFFPSGGEPAATNLTLKLKRKHPHRRVGTPPPA